VESRNRPRAWGAPSARNARWIAVAVWGLASALPLSALLAEGGFQIEGGDRVLVSGGVVYSRDLDEPVFKTTCAVAKCHDAETREEDLSFESFEEMTKGGDDGPVFIPGDSSSSELLLRLLGKKKPPMPLKQKPLPGETTRAIARWVDTGVLRLQATLAGAEAAASWSVVPDSFGIVSSNGYFTPNVEEGEGLVVAAYKTASDTIRVLVRREE